MGIFSRKVTAPAYASAPIAAAAAGVSQVGQFYSYSVGADEITALSVPTVARSIDLISSVAGSLDLKSYSLAWNGEEYEKIWIEGESWMNRPDPSVTRNFIMMKTARDLMLYGRAFWAVTSRYSTGYPATFTWLPANLVTTPDQAGPEFYGPSKNPQFNGMNLDPVNVIQFLSGSIGLLYQSSRGIRIALKLDQAAERFASTEIAAGYLQQRGGEPMSGEELGELAGAWAAARRENAIGALNEFVEWREYSSDPSKLQLVEARKYAALELARACNVPGYLLGIDQSGMTYQNAQQSRQDLYLFGAKPILHAIEERLSMDDVLPRGRHVIFNVDDYLQDYNMKETPVVQEPSPSVPTDQRTSA